MKISSVTGGTKLWITVWDNGPEFEGGMKMTPVVEQVKQ